MLDPARHTTLEALFHRACALAPADRAEFVRASCGADAELRAELAALVALDARPDGSDGLDTPAPVVEAQRRGTDESQAAPLPPLIGESTAATERYVLGDEIGRGGMGIVLRGRDLSLGREVALKILRGDRHQGGALLQRFVEEAQIGSQLQHPGIVPVYDLGLRDGQPYFTMKLVAGRTLASLLYERLDTAAQRRRLLAIFEHVCQAMAYAHARGVVHRDLKPANVMVGSFGEVLVMDWGMAKVLGRGAGEPAPAAEAEAGEREVRTVRTDTASGSRSVAGAVMGTPAYMPPEQASGQIERVDQRADVFALGAILVEILTGRPPYEGSQAEQIEQATHARLEPAELRLAACGADADLIAIARRCLHADPGSRWHDAGGLAEALAAHQAGVEERAQAAKVTAVAERAKAQEARRAQRLTLALAATVLLATTLFGLGYLWVESDRGRRVARAMGEVDRALEDAAQAVGQAESAADHEAAPWNRARAAADRVAAIIAASEVGATPLLRVERLRSQIDAGEASARTRAATLARDRALRDALPEIAIPQAATFELAGERQRDARRRDASYARAFVDYGIDVDALPPEVAAERVRASAIAATLIVALDDWGEARGAFDPDPAGRIRRWRIAREADTDPWRRGVRDRLIALSPDAREGLLAAAAAPPADLPPTSARLLAIGLEMVGERAASLRVLRAAHTRHPDDFLVALYLGMRHESATPRAWREALPAYSVAAALRPTSAMAQFRLASAQWNNGDAEAACGSYRRVLVLRPDFDPARAQLARLLNRLREPDAAIEVLAPILGRADSEFAGHALAELGQAQQLKGDLALATDTVRRAIERHPTVPEVHAQLADCLEAAGDLEGAIEALRATLRLDREHFLGSRYQLSHLLIATGRPAESAALMRERLAEAPEDSLALRILARAHRHQGETDQAIALYRAAIRAGADAETHRNLGILLGQTGNADAGILELTTAVRLAPDYADGWYSLGVLQLQREAHAQAVAAFERCAALHVELPSWPTPLAQMLAAARAGGERDQQVLRALDAGGEDAVAAPADALAAARLCVRRGTLAAAARLFATALTDPRIAGDLRGGARLEAARATLLAAVSSGTDAGAAIPRALSWLEADLEAWTRVLDAESARGRTHLRDTLTAWQEDAALAPVRDAARLRALAGPERSRCHALWLRVQELLDRAR